MDRDTLIDQSLISLFQTLPPEVAERVKSKYDQDRAEFMQVVKDMTPSKGPEFWAKPSCTRCHGRGMIGLLVSNQSKPLLCTCIEKRYRFWLKDVRRYYLALKEQQRGHDETK